MPVREITPDEIDAAPAIGVVREITEADIDREPLGVGAAVVHGVASVPGNTVRTLGMAPRWVGDKLGVVGAPSRAIAEAHDAVADAIDETLRHPVRAVTGRDLGEQPATRGERIAHAIGAGVGGFATLPMGGIGGLASSIMAAVASESAREAGLPGWATVLAGVAGGASPAVAGRIAPSIPGVAAVTGRVGRAGVLPGTSQMRADAARMGAAQTLRAQVDDVAQAADDLLRESRGLNGPGLASTAQTLRTRSPDMMGFEGGLLKSSTGGLGERLAARRAQSANQIDDAFGAAFRGHPGAVRGGFAEQIAQSRRRYQALYGAIDDASVGTVSLAPLRERADAIIAEAGRPGASGVPALARLAANADDAVSFSELRRWRTALTDEARDLRRAVATGGSSARLRNVERLRDSVDGIIDGLEASGTPAATQLREANAAFRAHQAIYSRAHPSVRRLVDNEDAADALVPILNRSAARPVEDARRLVAGLGDDAEALEGLRRLTADEILWRSMGRSVKSRGVAAPSAASGTSLGVQLVENEGPLRVLFGDEQYTLMRRLAERIDTTTYGRGGTAGFSMSTGSAFKDAEEQSMAGAAAAAEMLGAVMRPGSTVRQKAMEKAREWLMDSATAAEQRRLLEDAMVDPKVARDLLLDVTPERFVAWQARMKEHINRSTARAGLTQRTTEER